MRKEGHKRMLKKLLEILEDIKPGYEFQGKQGLVDKGELDSFDVITLVSELHDVFDAQIPVEAIEPVNFNSIEAMINLIEKYT